MIHVDIKIDPNDVMLAITHATISNNDFLLHYTFDPYDMLTGGSGFPDASPAEIALYNANNEFLDTIRAAYEKCANAYNLNKNKEYICSWKDGTGAAEKKGGAQ